MPSEPKTFPWLFLNRAAGPSGISEDTVYLQCIQCNRSGTQFIRVSLLPTLIDWHLVRVESDDHQGHEMYARVSKQARKKPTESRTERLSSLFLHAFPKFHEQLILRAENTMTLQNEPCRQLSIRHFTVAMARTSSCFVIPQTLSNSASFLAVTESKRWCFFLALCRLGTLPSVARRSFLLFLRDSFLLPDFLNEFLSPGMSSSWCAILLHSSPVTTDSSCPDDTKRHDFKQSQYKVSDYVKLPDFALSGKQIKNRGAMLQIWLCNDLFSNKTSQHSSPMALPKQCMPCILCLTCIRCEDIRFRPNLLN